MPSIGFSRSASPMSTNHSTEMDVWNSAKKKVMNSGLRNVDSNAVPTFLAQFFETENFSTLSKERIICLFEVLGEVHGPEIVPQINYVMDSVIKTLTSSDVLNPVQHACAKLVSGISMYGIHPLTAEDKKREIVCSLCKPLSNLILGVQEGLVYGSALCLEALVKSANWRFASDEIVNEVCLKVAVALEEKPTQTNAHMTLAMALVKHSILIIEPYARSLIRSGLRILNDGVEENDSQKQLSAIQMVNLLMKCVDPRSVFSELETVSKEMEKCYSDQIEFVRSAAFEAMQTARRIVREKGSRIEDSGSVTDSNFATRSNCRNEIVRGLRERSLVSAPPDSQYVYSSFECDFSAQSLVSTNQLSCKFDYSGSAVKRKLWKQEVDGSLSKDFHSCTSLSSNALKVDSKLFDDGETNKKDIDDMPLSRFMHAIPTDGVITTTSASSSPESARSPLDANDHKFFTSRKEFIRSLQDSDLNVPKKRIRRSRRPPSNQRALNLTRGRYGHHNFETSAKIFQTREQAIDSKSVSSKSDIAADVDFKVSHGVDCESKVAFEHQSAKQKAPCKVVLTLVVSLSLILLSVIVLLVWLDNQAGLHFFPT